MVTFVRPGDLRVRLVLEQAVEVPDGAGGFAENWNEVAAFLAFVEPVAARDRFGAGQTLEEISHRIIIRHRHDIESGMRLRRGSRLFAVKTVHDPDETGRYLVIWAQEQGR